VRLPSGFRKAVMRSEKAKIVSCGRCGQRLRIPMDRGSLEVTCPPCGYRWHWGDSDKNSAAQPIPRTLPEGGRAVSSAKARKHCFWALGLGLVAAAICTAFFIEAGTHLTPSTVNVSGYYRQSGAYVRPYSRRPPGGVAHDSPYEWIRFFCGIGIVIGVGTSAVSAANLFGRSSEVPNSNNRDNVQRPRTSRTVRRGVRNAQCCPRH
jgi:DNA-directed RNA polymerase subunit RPC12/RpoP